MTATTAVNGASTRPPVHAELRLVAAWLESHPEIRPDQVCFPPLREEIVIYRYGVKAGQMADLARQIGGHWERHTDEEYDLFALRQEIAPGIRVELVGDTVAVYEGLAA